MKLVTVLPAHPGMYGIRELATEVIAELIVAWAVTETDNGVVMTGVGISAPSCHLAIGTNVLDDALPFAYYTSKVPGDATVIR